MRREEDGAALGGEEHVLHGDGLVALGDFVEGFDLGGVLGPHPQGFFGGEEDGHEFGVSVDGRPGLGGRVVEKGLRIDLIVFREGTELLQRERAACVGLGGFADVVFLRGGHVGGV